MTQSTSTPRPGKLFLILWLFTIITELISLQVRLAIFGGTGWLTFTKYISTSERIGFVTTLAVLCGAIIGIWTLIFDAIGRRIKADFYRTARICATSWVVIVVIDLFFRHKITELLGNAFSFFEFATGVGGVWRMIVQAFQWYGDVILIAILTIAAFGVATYFLFKFFFKPHEKTSWIEKIPRSVLILFTIFTFIFSALFMSVLAPKFPATHKVFAEETMFGAAFNALVNVTTDFDNDGYGAFDLPPDIHPFDGQSHPHALDIPDDGMDQDQILGDLKTADIPTSSKKYIESMGMPLNLSPNDRRHVILVLMESVRYDMLDAKVDGIPVMPNLNRFIQMGATRVDRAFATRGFTQNSVTQTFWGSYFDPGHSLVDDFKALGYHTAAFSGEELQDEKFDESLGWNRAGDTVVDPKSIEANIYHHRSVPALTLMDEVEKFIQGYDTQQPLFMYLFYQDPHFPYQQDNPNVLNDRPIQRTEITVQTRPRLYRTYANQVHHLDMAAGRLIDALKNKKMLDDSIVIFISDHGESLFDDGYMLGHGIAIQDLMTHCVMTIWGAHHDIPDMMSHIDIRPFIHQDLISSWTHPHADASFPVKTIHLKPQQRPVLQYIGATTVPSAISWRYHSGDRITYEFASQSAWRETTSASFDNQKERLSIPPHENDPVDKTISITESLTPSGKYYSPVHNPLANPEIQQLIHTWEYMQWFHEHD